MKTEVTAVAHKGQKVGEVSVVIYESIAELTANETESQILNLFNKMNKIRIQANERVKHAEGRIGKQKVRSMAFNLLTPDEISQYAGNFDALQKFLDSDEMSERVKSQMK